MDFSSVAAFVNRVSIFEAVCCTLVCVVVAIILRHRYLSSISSIPGPALGTVSNFFKLWEAVKGTFPQTLLRLHHKHGTFVRISYNEVSVDHPEALTKILAAPLVKPSHYDIFAIPNTNYHNLMSQQSIPQHTAMLRNVAPAYSMSNVIQSEQKIDEAIALLEHRLDQQIEQGKPVEMNDWLHFTTWDIMGIATFSRPFGFLEQGKDVGGSIKNNFGLAIYITAMVSLQWLHRLLLGNPILRWLDFQPALHTFNVAKSAVAARKAETEPRFDMMQRWLDRREKHPDTMSERMLLAAALQNLGAGGDTAGSVLQAFFYLLLKEDDRVLKKLRSEIDTATAKGEFSNIVSYAEAQNLPYLQAVLKETGRLCPGVPWNIARIVPEEGLTIAGQHFTEGTVLSVNAWVIHRNKECFGQDADVYNPERWLGDPTSVKHMERNMVLFGLGYNTCVGRNLAILEMNKITATLVRDFELELVEPNAEWKRHFLLVTVPWGWPVWARRREHARM